MNHRHHSPWIIWRLIDGKPGHENQSLGLSNALKNKTGCQVIDIPVSNNLKTLLDLFLARWPQGQGLPSPDLIIGAGHQTHLSLLAATRAYGGRTIVLMKPSLPARFFDLCIIPEHDAYQGKGLFLETKGVLNALQASGEHAQQKALIMIGGPSKHYHWDAPALLEQIQQLLQQNADITYILTTSRRTPRDFTDQLQQITQPNLQIVPVEKTEPGWVAKHLAESGSAWISEDSVSMVYEALTAQVAVGLLNIPTQQANRISRGIEQLVQQNTLCRFDKEGHYRQYLKPANGFQEADRCADWIANTWLSQN